VVVAARPGELTELLDEAGADVRAVDGVVAFDPDRSRDAVLDLVALAGATGARRVLVGAGAEPLDATVRSELARRRVDVVEISRNG
jgi:hypothetical protein